MIRARLTFSAVVVVGAIVLAAVPQLAAGAYFYEWGTLPSTSITDPYPDEPPTTSGQDITKAWQASDGTYLYFRVDLAGAPSVPGNYADTYGLFIDANDGGAPNENDYVPGTLSGVDYIVSSQYEVEHHRFEEWDAEAKTWIVDEFEDSDDVQFQTVNGTTLEWKVKNGLCGADLIGSAFTWWAATMLPGDDGKGKVMYDITGAVATPIPNAAWLLGGGLIALIGLKRRKAARA